MPTHAFTPHLTSRPVCLNSAQVRQGPVRLQGDPFEKREDQTRCARPPAAASLSVCAYALPAANVVNKEEMHLAKLEGAQTADTSRRTGFFLLLDFRGMEV